MATISTVFADRATGPYAKALKVKVLAVDEVLKYRGKDGLEKSALTSAVSDGVKVVKTVCYDSSKFLKFKVGTTLVLRDIIRKRENEMMSIVVTRVTKILISAPIQVPSDHEAEAARLINPPPTEKVTISKALASPLKQKVSIGGKIVQEDEPHQVTVRGEEVNIKTVTVEDHTGKAKVTLWRAAAGSPVRPGDHVEITDLVVNLYQNTTTLQTTNKSKVEKSEAPLELAEVMVEAVGVVEGEAELYLANGEITSVPVELLQQTLGLECDIELATAEGPVKFRIERRGSDVLSVAKM